jgi:hypothetical protein
MSSLKNSLLAALASAALTAGCLCAIHNRRAEEAAHLRYDNDRMLRLEADRLRRIQSSATQPATADTVGAALPAPTDTFAPNSSNAGDDRNEDQTASVAALSVRTGTSVSNSAAAGDYRNEGQATPLATLQTFAWACDRGDNEAVANLLCFDPAGRAKAVAYMATLPANSHPQWSTPEEMAAAILTSETMERPFPGTTILDTATVEKINEDRVMLRLPDTRKDRTMYQKTEAGWKYVVTDKMVDDYIARGGRPRD